VTVELEADRFFTWWYRRFRFCLLYCNNWNATWPQRHINYCSSTRESYI